MPQHDTNRRTFIGGAAAGVAMIGGLSLFDSDDAVTLPNELRGVTVVPGTGRIAPSSTQAALAVTDLPLGKPVTLVAEGGRASAAIFAVTPVATRGPRPAGVRRQPFNVYLAMDPAVAPAGNRIYSLAEPIAGLNDVFLSRGDDVGGKAILIALFA